MLELLPQSNQVAPLAWPLCLKKTVLLMGCSSQRHRRDETEEAPGVLWKPGFWIWDWVMTFVMLECLGSVSAGFLSRDRQQPGQVDREKELVE